VVFARLRQHCMLQYSRQSLRWLKGKTFNAFGYVEPGQDATISEGYIDFKFRNNTDRACLISASVVGNRIDIKLLGAKRNSNYDVRLKSVVVERISPPEDEIIVDKSLPKGAVKIEREPVQG